MTKNIHYLAGILDGEGYIGIAKISHPKGTKSMHNNPQYRPIIRVANTSIDLMNVLVKYYGGSYHKKTKTKAYHRDCYVFNMTKSSMELLLAPLIKILVIKKRQAELLLNLINIKCLSGTSYTSEQIILRDKLYEHCLKLNKRSSVEPCFLIGMV